MDDTSTGPCCVCGAVTTHRCSSCAGEAGFDLFFCSREHQKLVWFAHKKVCGKIARPFRSPGLTPEEVEYAKATAYRPGVGQRSLGKHFEKVMGLSRVEVLRFLDALQTPPNQNLVADDFLLAKEFFLGRTRDYMRRCRASHNKSSHGDVTSLLQLDPFTLLGSFVDKTQGQLFGSDGPYEGRHLELHDWLNPLYHHIVIGATVWLRCMKDLQMQRNNNVNSLEEIAPLQTTAFQPILADLTSLHCRDEQLAAIVANEVGAMTCFKRFSIHLVDGVYEAKLTDEEEWETEESYESYED